MKTYTFCAFNARWSSKAAGLPKLLTPIDTPFIGRSSNVVCEGPLTTQLEILRAAAISKANILPSVSPVKFWKSTRVPANGTSAFWIASTCLGESRLQATSFSSLIRASISSSASFFNCTASFSTSLARVSALPASSLAFFADPWASAAALAALSADIPASAARVVAIPAFWLTNPTNSLFFVRRSLFIRPDETLTHNSPATPAVTRMIPSSSNRKNHTLGFSGVRMVDRRHAWRASTYSLTITITSKATPIATSAVQTLSQNSSDSDEASRIDMEFPRAEIALSKAEGFMKSLHHTQEECAIMMTTLVFLEIVIDIWVFLKYRG